jgi:hypothetical protein
MSRTALFLMTVLVGVSTSACVPPLNPGDNVKKSGGANLTVKVLIPDYRGAHERAVKAKTGSKAASRVIDPQTQKMVLTLTDANNVVSTQEILIDVSSLAPYADRPGAVPTVQVTGSFYADSGFYYSLYVEFRDDNGVALTRGSLPDITINPGTNTLNMSCLPASYQTLGFGQPAADTVGDNAMMYYAISVMPGSPVDISLDYTSGSPDLYIFNPDGGIKAAVYGLSTPVATTQVFNVSTTSTAYVGVYGYQQSDYSIKVVPWAVSIADPQVNGTVSGQYIFSGNYTGGISYIAITIDGWLRYDAASGVGFWSTEVDTTQLTNGSHLVNVAGADTPFGGPTPTFKVETGLMSFFVTGGIQESGYSISGTIDRNFDVGAVTAATPMYVYVMQGGSPYKAITVTSDSFPYSYTLSGLPDGEYSVGAFINFTGSQDAGAPGNAAAMYPSSLTVSGGDITGIDLFLTMNPLVNSVSGTLSLPQEVDSQSVLGKFYWVVVDDDQINENGYAAAYANYWPGGASIAYTVSGFNLGSYYIYAGVDMDWSGGEPTVGDLMGPAANNPVSIYGAMTGVDIQLTVFQNGPPSITVSEPTNGTEVTMNKLTVSGTVSDPQGVSDVTSILVWIADTGFNQAASVSVVLCYPDGNGNWTSSPQLDIKSLANGSYYVGAAAFDSASNNGIAYVPITVSLGTGELIIQ